MQLSLPSFLKKKEKEGAGDFEQTLAAYRKTAEANPQDLRIHTKIAELYLGHGDTASAITEYLNAAKVYQQAGKDKLVLAVYRHIISLDPGRVDVYQRLCDACMQSYLVGDAVEVMISLATYYYDSDMHYEAAQAIKGINDLDPDNKFYKTKVSKFFRDRNLCPGDVEKIGPRGKWTLVGEAPKGSESREETQPPAGGFFDLQQVLDESSINTLDGSAGTSSLSVDKVQPDMVLDQLKNLVGADAQEDSPEFHYNLGQAYIRRGEHDQALEQLQKAVGGIGGRLDCYFLMMDCGMTLKRFDEVKRFIADAAKLPALSDADKMALQYRSGLLCKAQGDRREALKIFKKIYDKDSHFKNVAKEVRELS